MYSDRIMAFGHLLMALKKQEMNKQNPYENLKLEEIIKRDDFISVTNESNNSFSDYNPTVVQHVYKVKMKSVKKLVYGAYPTPTQYKYFDMFDREVPHSDYYFFITKPLDWYYIVKPDFTIREVPPYVTAPADTKVFRTRREADMYVYDNKKAYTQKEVDEKTKAAYENGKEVGWFDQGYHKKAAEVLQREAAVKAFLDNWRKYM